MKIKIVILYFIFFAGNYQFCIDSFIYLFNFILKIQYNQK